ncbi:MAG: hypothetical protein KF760_09145 [Candidatus Eremiobacteraeota bacterium]|nr:hypothetical protein [Candidatus Eremiobacteraeota bacterium]MCW5869386.1 hypothetical protein [Candidatus Eremiobacteraeota bacterium]
MHIPSSLHPSASTRPSQPRQQHPQPGEEVVLLQDDMEQANDTWLLRGPWGRVEADGRGKVFTESPDGPYEPNANVRLVSQPIRLDVKDPRLEFALRFDTQPGADPVTVEIAENHAHKTLRHDWVELARFSGQSDWGFYSLALNGWENKEIQFRFRLQSDSQDQREGLQVDDVKLYGRALEV